MHTRSSSLKKPSNNRPLPANLTNLLFALLLCFCGSSPFSFADPKQKAYKTSFVAFDVNFSITLIGGNKSRNARLSAEIKQELLYLQQAWNPWHSGALSRVNRLLPSTVWFSFAPSIRNILLRARSLSLQSNHYFNPALGNLNKLWGFHQPQPHQRKPPDDAAIGKLINAGPRMDHLIIQGIRIKSTHPALLLDLSQITKGYAVDYLIAYLKQQGVKHAMIKAGENYKVIGLQQARPWKIKLTVAQSKPLPDLLLSNGEAAFTLTNRLKQFEYNQHTYHATLDPRTGYPVTHTQSVTVIHQQASIADAAATALFVAGPENWKAIAQNMRIKYVILIDSNGKIHLSEAMRKRIAPIVN